MALSANTPRIYDGHGAFSDAKIQQLTATTIYEGAALGSSGGYARPFNDGDVFLGFAMEYSANAGASGSVSVMARRDCEVLLPVGGTLAITDIGATVYATADGTFSKTDSGSDTTIGKISRFESTTHAWVKAQAVPLRSL